MPLDDVPPASRRPELREVRDAQSLRALSHPVRLALIETLSLQGPMTATEAGAQIGESPTTCSFHLRQLAKYGFVEEAGGGKGRARPWKMRTIGMRIPDVSGDAEAELAAGVLTRLLRERQLIRYQTWLETRAAYPARWRHAAGDSESVLYVTVEELEELSEELHALLLTRFRERITDPAARPPGALPVEILVLSYPIAPPPPQG